ncbi:Cobalt/magnesium transport protein CorA [Candidatus Bilamarchaeum dharawalense]|uniref:Magnesium transport protein CorA n=1 Tax=Candidatus Bilamarchaeum dharawalense TaxID=2885759 RepID=A0A5E4LWZ2_9ARCH|nr:Cobalt/magnesium transport protein CorA [Candidatus Bilamarchaeum dharawalense]
MLSTFMKKRSRKTGLPPGTPIFIGDKKTDKTSIYLFDYNNKSFCEHSTDSVKACLPYKDRSTVTWVDVDGLQDVELLQHLGHGFELHPLVMEDILNTGQRPKVEDQGKYLYIVLRMLRYDEQKEKVESEQFSIILSKNFVLTFQEGCMDLFDPIREQIRTKKGRIREYGTDYLVYSLIDIVIDNYFVILEKIGEKIEVLENELVTNPNPKTLNQIHHLKREIILLRKSVWPLREVINYLIHLGGERNGLIRPTTKIFLRDVYDHTIEIIESMETIRDILSGMLDIYLSSVSHRLNEVMKVLTIIATIFIPLTFVAGVYGMNFKFMPELESPYGYPAILIIMSLVAGTMLLYFRRKKWI